MSVFLSLRAETIYRIAFLRFDECWEKSARYTLDVAICKLNYLKCTAGGLYILANESPLSELEVMRTHEYFPNYCILIQFMYKWHVSLSVYHFADYLTKIRPKQGYI